MAIDRNALDAITGERKGKKNQSRFEDRNKLTVGGPDGNPVTVQPSTYRETPVTVEPRKSANNQSARQQLGLVDYGAFDINKYAPASRPAPMTVQPSTYRETPVTVEPQSPSSQYTGLMTRDVPKPGLGQVGVGGPMPIPPALSGDRAALAAMERMRPNQSPRPFQPAAPTQQAATTAEQAPTVERLTPLYVQSDAANKRDALRAQIASEQQRMLMARRQAEGARRKGITPPEFNEGESLKKIADMRSELAGYEKAALPPQQIKVKTAEQNLATDQDVARQAADIMQRDVDDLRYQLNLMPEGQAKANMQERLRSLEYQQQQQSARGRVLAPTEVGPQVRGASPELYQQMLAEGAARTERQREAAPRVAARQEALGEAAYRAAEGQQTGRIESEQRQKQIARAMQEATVAEIGAPERKRKLEEEVARTGIRKIESDILESQAKGDVARSQIKLNELQGKLAESQANWMRDPQNPKNQMDLTQVKLANFEAERRQRMLSGSAGLKTTEEIQSQIQNDDAQLQALNISGQNGAEANAMNAVLALNSEIGGTSGTEYVGSMFTGNAQGGINAVNKISLYASQLERLAQQNPELAKTKAALFLSGMPQPMSGTSRTFTSRATQGAAALGAGIVGVVGTPFTFGGSAVAGTAVIAGLETAQQLNEADKQKVFNNFNTARSTLERLAGTQIAQ